MTGRDKYQGLSVYQLKDVLACLPLPPQLDLDAVSPKWRCVIAPNVSAASSSTVDDEEEEVETLRFLDAGIPVFMSEKRAAEAYRECGGDAMTFVRNEHWCTFPKPQIAVRSGWGAPGTVLETSQYHKLIGSCAEVFEHKEGFEVPITKAERAAALAKEAESNAQEEDEEEGAGRQDVSTRVEGGDDGKEEILELQLFHRESPECPRMPILAGKLIWPSFLEDGIVCDIATNLSQCGYRRWWHLNDSGELVMQAALPLPSSCRASASVSEALPVLSSASAVPVKLCVYGPRGSYDWFLHDDEATVSGKVVSLDVLQSPDEVLPVDGSLLPILTIAVLEAGGCPLLTPPNLPTTAVTLTDGVVVEQRRQSKLWLDEISYFLKRTAQWTTNPLLYDYVETDLQDEAYVAGQLVPELVHRFGEVGNSNPHCRRLRRRLAASLFAIASHDKHFALSESSRQSLRMLVTRDNADMAAIMASSEGCVAEMEAAKSMSLSEFLTRYYWDVKALWPKAGCVLRAPRLTPSRLLSTALRASSEWVVPVVYCASRPVYGTEKATLEETVEEYFEMKELAGKPKELLTYLRCRKSEKDNVLDDLF